MAAIFRGRLGHCGVHDIGFRGGSKNEELYSDGHGKFWATAGNIPHQTTIPRYWNPLGVYDGTRRVQHIVVETNIPAEGPSGRIAAFFAEDEETGDRYLMHDGAIGGGRPGIGKQAFLVWSGVKLVDVKVRNGTFRQGFPVAKLEDNQRFIDRIANFVETVRDFKEEVTSKEFNSDLFNKRLEEFLRYTREHSGRKKGSRRGGPLDYITYHGDIVNALYNERSSRASNGEGVFNSQLIDLFVKRNGTITEVYEIKTGLTRQTLYTAIGQLMVHSQGRNDVARFLVLPDHEKVPDDITESINILGVKLRRFSLEGDEVILLPPS